MRLRLSLGSCGERENLDSGLEPNAVASVTDPGLGRRIQKSDFLQWSSKRVLKFLESGEGLLTPEHGLQTETQTQKICEETCTKPQTQTQTQTQLRDPLQFRFRLADPSQNFCWILGNGRVRVSEIAHAVNSGLLMLHTSKETILLCTGGSRSFGQGGQQSFDPKGGP